MEGGFSFATLAILPRLPCGARRPMSKLSSLVSRSPRWMSSFLSPLGSLYGIPLRLSLAPCGRLKTLSANRAPQDKTTQYCTNSMRRNALRPIHLPKHCFESPPGCFFWFLRSYKSACISCFGKGGAALERYFFNTGRDYGDYLNFTGNGLFYLSLDADWSAPSVVNALNGARDAGKCEIRFLSFIRLDVALNVTSAEAPPSQFAHLASCAFLLSLRVPPEALILRRGTLGARWI